MVVVVIVAPIERLMKIVAAIGAAATATAAAVVEAAVLARFLHAG